MTSLLPEPADAMICRCEPRCLTAASASPERVGAEESGIVDASRGGPPGPDTPDATCIGTGPASLDTAVAVWQGPGVSRPATGGVVQVARRPLEQRPMGRVVASRHLPIRR